MFQGTNACTSFDIVTAPNLDATHLPYPTACKCKTTQEDPLISGPQQQQQCRLGMWGCMVDMGGRHGCHSPWEKVPRACRLASPKTNTPPNPIHAYQCTSLVPELNYQSPMPEARKSKSIQCVIIHLHKYVTKWLAAIWKVIFLVLI